jgi:murein DD-endopeptidase MepM/ murein hydrolase activator NlpD
VTYDVGKFAEHDPIYTALPDLPIQTIGPPKTVEDDYHGTSYQMVQVSLAGQPDRPIGWIDTALLTNISQTRPIGQGTVQQPGGGLVQQAGGVVNALGGAKDSLGSAIGEALPSLPTPAPTAAPVPAPSEAPAAPITGGGMGNPLEAIGAAAGSVLDTVTGAVQGTMTGDQSNPTKPALTTKAAAPASADVPKALAGQPFFFDVVPSKDNFGIQSTDAADRTWMENMMGGHAVVTTDYKGPAPCEVMAADGTCQKKVSYVYQVGHGAIDGEHAAYDISCDTGNCAGTPVTSPVSGKVVCAGYGQGTGEALNANDSNNGCYYSEGTTIANNDGSAPSHTVTIQVGTDPQGNPIQLSFNHMGTSELTPGQQINVGDLIGGMGNTTGGPHTHLEAWGYSPSLGTYTILDPTLVVGGYYETHSVDDTGTTPAPTTTPSSTAPSTIPSKVTPRTSPGLTPGDPAAYQPLVQQAATDNGVPPKILSGLLQQESQYDPAALSPAGAQGIAQFMPETAAGYGIDPYDPTQAIPAAAQMLKENYDRFGSWDDALAAYNAGAGNVEKYGGVPPFPETQSYVDVILKNAGYR